MRSVLVCVGSSCHLKGAYEVINEFKRLLSEYSLSDRVELKAGFCLGKCQNGVSVMVDDEIYISLTKEKVEEFIREHLLLGKSQN